MKRNNGGSYLVRGIFSSNKYGPIWLFIPVLLLTFLAMLPLLYVIMRAREAGWEQAINLIFRSRVYELLWNTLRLDFSVTILSAIIGVSTAWFIVRTNLPGRKLWNAIVTLPFAIPAFVSSYSWISIQTGVEGFYWSVFILTFSSYPLVHLPVAAALKGMDPAHEETARSLGYGRLQIFFKVILPQLRPSLLGGAILIALHMLAEFGALAFLNYDTFTTAIFDQYNVTFDSASAAMLTFVLLILCIVVLGLEMLIRGNYKYARTSKGAPREPGIIALGWSRPIVFMGFLALAVLAVGVPLGAITYWLLTGSSAAFFLTEMFSALFATLSFGMSGSLLTVAFALPLVILAIRYRGFFSIVADRLPYFIHSLPGLVIGLTLVFFAIRFTYPLYQTVIVLLVGYAMLYLPLAQSPIRGALEQVPKQVEEIASSLGKSSFVVFLKVTLPLIIPGVGAGLALVFLNIMKELTATLLLRPNGVETLATKIWEHTTSIEYAASAPYAALLILFSGVPVYLLTMRSFLFRKEDKSS